MNMGSVLENCACLLPGGVHSDGDAANAGGRDVAIVAKGNLGGISKRGEVAEPASMQVGMDSIIAVVITIVVKVLPPEQVAELLPWYMQWSRDLAAEMHQRRLVRNEARRTVTLPISHRPCDCATEWRCEPHDACFIHDSCFCPGSGSFPPVKPPRS